MAAFLALLAMIAIGCLAQLAFKAWVDLQGFLRFVDMQVHLHTESDKVTLTNAS